MRIATYNVEWFSSLFDEENNLIIDASWSGRYDVTKQMQINALGHVFKAIDADAVMIIEAPDTSGSRSTEKSLENFARHFNLRQSQALVGYVNETQQEIALLYDPRKMDVSHAPKRPSKRAPAFDDVFTLGKDKNQQEPVRFSKPPLEVVLNPKGAGPNLRLIGVHAKSKAPHGAKTKAQEIKISMANRRKQLTQCLWIRRRVEQHLRKGDHLIVLGDFNDGPGLDKYETEFGHSGIEIVLGTTQKQDKKLYDPHAEQTLSRPFAVQPTTSRFYDHRTKTYLNALLDYIMISPNLRELGSHKWTIWHPFDHPECYSNQVICQALLAASDHFPVTLDLDFGSTLEK
jgi:hypothetical protein